MNEYGLTLAGTLREEALVKKKASAEAALASWAQQEAIAPKELLDLLVVLEALKSCQIEGYQTTLDSVLRSRLEPRSALEDDQVVLNTFHAICLAEVAAADRPVSASGTEWICSNILDQEMVVRKVPGTVIANAQTGEVIHQPPEGEAVIRDLLSGWEKVYHYGEDSLLESGRQHLIFESIHPFHDGNGRTGRVLNGLFMKERFGLRSMALPLSTMIRESREGYYEALSSVRATGDWTHWALYWLDVVEAAARAGEVFLRHESENIALSQHWANNGEVYFPELEWLLASVIVTPEAYAKKCDLDEATASSVLRVLCHNNVLQDRWGAFVNKKLLDSIEELSAPEKSALGKRTAKRKKAAFQRVLESLAKGQNNDG